MSATSELAYGDYLISPCLHQNNFYQPMTVPQTAPVPSSSVSLPQGDLFNTLGYMPQLLAQEDLFSALGYTMMAQRDLFNALGYTPVDIIQIQESICVQGDAQGLQFIPPKSQQIAPCSQLS
jgi:hypothetical protein